MTNPTREELISERVLTEGQPIWYVRSPRQHHRGTFIELSASGKKALVKYEIIGTTFTQTSYVDIKRVTPRHV